MDNVVNPGNVEQWKWYMDKDRLKHNMTMNSLGEYCSASKISRVQFLLLRALWSEPVKPRAFQVLAASLVGYSEMDVARKNLLRESNTEWSYYINALSHIQQGRNAQTRPRSHFGAFAIPWWQQLAITNLDFRSAPESSPIQLKDKYIRAIANNPDKDPETSPDFTSPVSKRIPHLDSKQKHAADDEAIVNVALISLLDALMINAKCERFEANAGRKRFEFGELWTAITDGYIGSMKNKDDIKAILEVKAADREGKRLYIQRQEAAEIAAWICCDKSVPKSDNWRVLIAQDYDKLWLIIARYPEKYVTYIQEEHSPSTTDTTSFLQLTECGPFAMSNANDMTLFATFISAFCSHHDKLDRQKETLGRQPADRKGSLGPRLTPRQPSEKMLMEGIRGLNLKAGPKAGPSTPSRPHTARKDFEGSGGSGPDQHSPLAHYPRPHHR